MSWDALAPYEAAIVFAFGYLFGVVTTELLVRWGMRGPS